MSGITKRFGDAVVNRDVNFDLAAGEIVALLGENGAGKTTLMNILFGLYRPEAGSISLDRKRLSIRSPTDAMALGIGMVHQHAHVVKRHSVIENLLVGRPGAGWRLARTSLTQRLEEIRRLYDLWLDPDRRVADLSVGEIQRLEILRALIDDARILILDEPTSVLTPQQTESLFVALRGMSGRGVGIVMISHKLDEVRALAHRVVVMRRGEVVGRLTNDGTLTNARLSHLMCGRAVEPVRRPAAALVKGAPLLTFQSERRGRLTLNGGEILCLAGISGNGQVELAEQICGLAPLAGARLTIAGQPVLDPSPSRMQALRLSYIPEDRQGAGMVGAMTLAQNLILARSRNRPFSRWGWFFPDAIRHFAEQQIADYDIRPPRADLRAALYSGGNQQKCLLARELSFDPQVLVVAYPTRGLDVQASGFVYRKLFELREKGCAQLVISDDLDEVFTLADRVAVICDGRLVFDRPAGITTPEEVGLAMMGGHGPTAAPVADEVA